MLAWRKLVSLERLAPPAGPQLLSELGADGADAGDFTEVERRLAIAELNQLLSDVSFELEVSPSTYTALIRISLSSGSALALVSFLVSPTETLPLRALCLAVAAIGGALGAGVVALVGRSAKGRITRIRAAWDRSSRDIGKALGTSLAVGPAIRGNSFPE